MEENVRNRNSAWFVSYTMRLCLASATLAIVAPAALPADAPTNAEVRPAMYQATIADLMTLGIQPRHIKVALALRAKNWAYAAYETRELRGALIRIVRAVPLIDRKFDTWAMIQTTVTAPLQNLSDAIEAKDATASKAAYTALTKGCSACHQAVNHGLIVIEEPRSDDFPDQDFRPKPAR